MVAAAGHLRDEEAFSGCRFRPLLPSRQVATLLGAIVPTSKQLAFVRDQMADTCPLLRLCGHNVDTKGGHRWALEGKQRDTGAGWSFKTSRHRKTRTSRRRDWRFRANASKGRQWLLSFDLSSKYPTNVSLKRDFSVHFYKTWHKARNKKQNIDFIVRLHLMCEVCFDHRKNRSQIDSVDVFSCNNG